MGANTTTVLIAGDDAEARATLAAALSWSNVAAVDAGALARARELESIGFLQLTFAATERIRWNAGFTLVQ